MIGDVQATAADLALEWGGTRDHEGLEPDPDVVTVLTAPARDRYGRELRATKRWRLGPNGTPVKDAYGSGDVFRCTQFRTRSIHELADLLDNLVCRSRSFVVRGEPIDPLMINGIGYRTLHPQPDGRPPTFMPAARAWVAMDFDDILMPRAYDLATPDDARAAMVQLRATLSPEFHGAACYCSLTSSAGFADPSLVSARLWFRVSRPVSDAEWRTWHKRTSAIVDWRLFNPVQIHYTAAPIFGEGVTDPIPVRSGVLPGALEVEFGDYSPPPPPPREPYVPRPRDDGEGDRRGRHYAVRALASIAAELARRIPGDRNDRLFHAALRAGGLVPGQWLREHEIYEELTAAARANGDARDRRDIGETIGRGLAAGATKAWDPPTRES